jgi:hypothetical protein
MDHKEIKAKINELKGREKNIQRGQQNTYLEMLILVNEIEVLNNQTSFRPFKMQLNLLTGKVNREMNKIIETLK